MHQTINSQENLDSLLTDAKAFIYREYSDKIDNKSIFTLIDKYDDIPESYQKAEVNYVLSHYYTSIYDYEKAYELRNKSRDQYLRYGDYKKFASSSKSLAIILSKLDKLSKIEDVLLEAISVGKKEDIGYYILKPLHELTIHYSYDLNNPKKAIKTGLEFLKQLEKFNSLGITDKDFIYSKTVDAHIVYLELGNSYVKLGKLDEGKTYLDKALLFFEGDYEKSARIYSHLIDWSLKSNSSNQVTRNYIKKYQEVTLKKRQEEKFRDSEVFSELLKVKPLEAKLEKETIENEFLKKQRLTIVAFFTALMVLAMITIVILKKYNKTQNKLNKKLIEEKVLLESIDRDRNMHLSIIAHELRTPIFTAKGLLDSIDFNDNSYTEYVDQIKGAINYLSNTISNILSMPVLKNKNAFQGYLHSKEFVITEYVQDLIENYSYLALQKRVNIHFSFEGISDNTKVIGVKQNLGQVLSNLIHNAIKFSPTGETVNVAISKVNQTSKTITVKFSVQDNGIGIKKSLQSKIFEYRKRLVKDKDKNTSFTEGLGIGLYTVQKILKTQNSYIQLDSEEGKGSLFYFTLEFQLPIQKEDQVLSDIHTDNTHDLELKILIIDDNKLNALVAKKLVESLNHCAFVCTDDEDFLTIIEEKSINFVITDINMPITNGYDVTKMIKSSKNIPVIAHTAADDISMNSPKVKASGLDGILIKPYDQDELSQKIKDVFTS